MGFGELGEEGYLLSESWGAQVIILGDLGAILLEI